MRRFCAGGKCIESVYLEGNAPTMRMCAGLEWNAGRCGKAEGGPEESKKRGLVGFGSEKAVQRGGASMAVTRSPAGFHYFRFLLQLISQVKVTTLIYMI